MKQVSLGAKIGEVKITKKEYYFLLIPICTVVVFIINGLASNAYHIEDPEWKGEVWWKFSPIAILVAAVHECLHALGFLYWGKVPLRAIKFGYIWKIFAPYCGLMEPVEVRYFRIALVVPFLVLAPSSLLVLLIFPSALTTMIMGFSTVTCSVDLWTFLRLHKFDRHSILNGDPSADLGYLIYAPLQERVDSDSEEKVSDAEKGVGDASGDTTI